jgi:hypothetical protein
VVERNVAKVMRRHFNKLNNLWPPTPNPPPSLGQICENLDAQGRGINLGEHGCPADGVVIAEAVVVGGKCPDGTDPVKDARDQQACIYKSTQLGEGTFEQLAPGGKPDVTKYHYDKTTGMLFFYVVQNEANAFASSPIGSCVNGTDPACPDKDESFYGCPAQGCTTYTVQIMDGGYSPGPSQCGGGGEADLYAKVPKYVLPEPTNANQLGYAPPFPPGIDAKSPVVAQSLKSTQGFAHRVAVTSPICTGMP